MLSQNESEIRAFFHKDAVIMWHCTNERFTLDEFIRANCEYPGEWDGAIERFEMNGDLAVTAVRVFSKDGSVSCHVTSFIHIKDDRIISMDEYWADDGEAPGWRKAMDIGTPIR